MGLPVLRLALLCGLTIGPALADPVSDGFAAYQRGDYLTAYRLCLPWARNGDSTAALILGLMYANGRGVPQDNTRAAGWYGAAADAGDDVAENNLGLMYAAGRGVRQSDSQAAKLFWLAANQGNPRAQYNLAVAYKDGKGVDQSYVHAYMWYSLSMTADWDAAIHAKAVRERDDVAKLMTEAQIGEARADVAHWQPTVRRVGPRQQPSMIDNPPSDR